MSFGARFLSHPELMPARIAGEAGGSETLGLRIAGRRHVVAGLDADQSAGVAERFRGFLEADEDPGGDVRTQVFRVAPGEFRAIDTRGWDYDLDLDAGAQHASLAGLRFMARIEWRPELRAALWTAATPAEFPGALENLLRVLTAYELLERGGLLLHSAGVAGVSGAWLFVGRAGAGKSTLSRLGIALGHSVLSDDLNAVWWEQDRPVSGPVPFAGDLRAPAAARAQPLLGLFSLRQGRSHATAALSRGAAAAALVACSPYVCRDPHRGDSLLRNVEMLLARMAVRELSFAPDAGFWPLVEECEPALVAESCP